MVLNQWCRILLFTALFNMVHQNATVVASEFNNENNGRSYEQSEKIEQLKGIVKPIGEVWNEVFYLENEEQKYYLMVPQHLVAAAKLVRNKRAEVRGVIFKDGEDLYVEVVNIRPI